MHLNPRWSISKTWMHGNHPGKILIQLIRNAPEQQSSKSSAGDSNVQPRQGGPCFLNFCREELSIPLPHFLTSCLFLDHDNVASALAKPSQGLSAMLTFSLLSSSSFFSLSLSSALLLLTPYLQPSSPSRRPLPPGGTSVFDSHASV